MELAQFEFKRERKLSEFVQDFINLLKLIFGHLSTVLLKMLTLPICGMLLVGYYISTQLNLHADYSSGEVVDIVLLFALAVGAMVLIGLFAFGFSIEYFILLRDRRKTDFTGSDIWQQFKINILKYFRFLLAAVIVVVIIFIPVALAIFLSAFVPFVGTFMVGIITAMVGVWFFTAFMLYREDYYDLVDTFTAAFSMLKSKIWEYGVASYLVNFLFQALLSLISIIPVALFAFLSYTYVGFNDNFFDTFWGRIVVTGGSLLVTLFFILYYMLAVISYGIIYETAKELRFGDDMFERISNIGRRKVDV